MLDSFEPYTTLQNVNVVLHTAQQLTRNEGNSFDPVRDGELKQLPGIALRHTVHCLTTGRCSADHAQCELLRESDRG